MKKPSQEQLDQLQAELDTIAEEFRSRLGQEDADYIRKLIRLQRSLDFSGRGALMLSFLNPLLWPAGVAMLSTAKILDNMEIGHNVLHGQYDWMNDPHINSRTYEWDIACDAESWKRTHNYEHHTFTNIIGKDRDFGYGLLRMSDDFAWRPKNRWQFLTYLQLSFLFEWGVSYHELAGERVFTGKPKDGRKGGVSHAKLKQAFFDKGKRQILKDYALFPALAGPMALPVLAGNWSANVIRNFWTSTIIFCGHFTEDVHTFTEDECKGESKGHWYYRQMLGSSNFTGPRWLHIMSGHLSCQIEHHLFTDIPARHYIEMAPRVQAIAEKHGIPYNTGSFLKQYSGVVKRILKYSFPDKKAKPEPAIAA